MVELIEMVEKNNTLITINYGTFYLIWNISFRVCNNAWIMPRFGKQHFHPFSLSIFKMNDILLILKIYFLYTFSGYQTRIFLSKSVILIVLCLVFTNSLFPTIFTQWFKGKLFF